MVHFWPTLYNGNGIPCIAMAAMKMLAQYYAKHSSYTYPLNQFSVTELHVKQWHSFQHNCEQYKKLHS